jgi:probable selenium-dependent hydroxylase accessory protein YqeC
VELYSALGVGSGDIAAFAGAGGKSGAIVRIADELRVAGMRVLVVPTTKMFVDEAERIGPLVTAGELEELRAQAEAALDGNRAVVAGNALISKERIGGVEPGWVPDLAKLADVVLVEADGSRRRPLKGTADHEPLLPDGVTLVVAVGNVQALGMPVNEENVHRPELFSELTGVGIGHSITPDAMALALARGSLGKVPEGVRCAALLTGVEPGQLMSDASIVARELWNLGVQNVVLSSLSEESVAEVWVP